jgi:hypothetical protein
MKRIPEEDEARIRELAEEYDVPLYVVRSLYDVMPNELYDGIVVALEDLEAEGLLEELYGVDSTLDYKSSEEDKHPSSL